MQTPRTGRPRLAPSPRAVAIPTRRPVKVPGPSPTAISSTASQPPAAAAAGLDLGQQAGRVPGPSLRGKPQLRLVKYLAVAPGAGDGIYRRGIEPDDDQGFATR